MVKVQEKLRLPIVFLLCIDRSIHMVQQLLRTDDMTDWTGTYRLVLDGVFKGADRSFTKQEVATLIIAPLEGGPGAYTFTLKFRFLENQSIGQAYVDCKGSRVLRLLALNASLDLVATSVVDTVVQKGRTTGSLQYPDLPRTGLLSGPFIRVVLGG